MANVKLYVRSKIKGKLATVYVRFFINREKDYGVPTPYKVPPEWWDQKNQKFKSNITYTDIFTEDKRAVLEDDFIEFKQFIKMESVKGTREMSTQYLQTLVNKYYGEKEGNVPETLNTYLARYISKVEKGEKLTVKKKAVFSSHTLKAYKSFQTQFNNYQREKKQTLNFSDITTDFYDDFVNHFYSQNYSPNTVGKLVKILKIIMREAMEEGYHQNREFERKRFKVITVPTEQIYLTDAELRKLLNLKLHNHKHYELARNIFLVGCYTAQRFGDYSRIRLSDVKEREGVKVIELIQQKTGERVMIPCKPELLVTLERLGNNPPKIWEQKVNQYIKKVAWVAKIKEKVTTESLKGGMKVITKVEKCELIKTHTARRTGCTLMYLSDIPSISIMKISGHKTESEFLKYIRISQEETALKLATNPYFIGNPLSIAK